MCAHVIWVKKNVEVYSCLEAPPIYNILYAHVHLVRTLVYQMHSKEMKVEKDGGEQNAILTPSIHLAFSYCKRQHAMLSATTFIFLLYFFQL